MYLGKLRDIAANELKTGVTDAVITVPGWFTSNRHRCCLYRQPQRPSSHQRSTATALEYGITKADLPKTLIMSSFLMLAIQICPLLL